MEIWPEASPSDRGGTAVGTAAQLAEILDAFGSRGEALTWVFLELEAWGMGEGPPDDLREELRALSRFNYGTDVRQAVRDIPGGLQMSWHELPKFAAQFDQFWWAVLVGCEDPAELLKVDRSELGTHWIEPRPPELYEASEIVVEAVDASMWHVWGRDDAVIERIRSHFADVRASDIPPRR